MLFNAIKEEVEFYVNNELADTSYLSEEEIKKLKKVDKKKIDKIANEVLNDSSFNEELFSTIRFYLYN